MVEKSVEPATFVGVVGTQHPGGGDLLIAAPARAGDVAAAQHDYAIIRAEPQHHFGMEGACVFGACQQVLLPEVPKLTGCRLCRRRDLVLVAEHEDVTRPAGPEVWQYHLLKENGVEGIGQQQGLMIRALAAEQPGIHAPASSVSTVRALLSTISPSAVMPPPSINLSCVSQPKACWRREAVRPPPKPLPRENH